MATYGGRTTITIRRCASCARRPVMRGSSNEYNRDRPAQLRGDWVLHSFHSHHTRHHLLGGAPHANDGALLRGGTNNQSWSEWLRARRRLHERGVFPGYRRPRVDHGFRWAHLLDRLARWLAGSALSHRRAVAESREV